MPDKAQVTETKEEYLNRRTKEILCEGGYGWEQFSPEEKAAAFMQAEKDWKDKP